MKRRAMIFAPNPTGRLHVGNALVLWLTAREARARDCDLYVRIDERRWTGQRSYEVRPEAFHSIEKSARLLDIEIAKVYWARDRRDRYWEAVQELLELKAAAPRPCFADDYVLTTYFLFSDLVEDHIRGSMDPIGIGIWQKGKTTAVLSNPVDFLDFDVPLHIRDIHTGVKSHWEALIQHRLSLREPTHYAHVPKIQDQEGNTLSKSQGYPDAYSFETFAQRFGCAEERRRALEAMVAFVPGAALKHILTANTIRVTPEGKRVGHAY